MDKLYVNQPGGFPMTTNILNALQNAYKIFNSLGSIAGNYAIISGCEVNGTKVEEGVVFIDGELYPFKGGVISSKVRIIENPILKQFKDGSTREVIFKRWAEFGSDVNAIDWSEFERFDPLTTITKKIASLEERLNKTVPIGLVAIWDRPADQIPDGWVEHTEMQSKIPLGRDLTGTGIYNKLGKTLLSRSSDHWYYSSNIYDNGGDDDYSYGHISSRIVRFIRFEGVQNN